MKWSSGKESHNSKAPGKSYLNRLISNLIFPATGLIICSIGVGMFLSGDAAKQKLTILASVSARKTPAEIDSIAHEISVKVLDRDFLGSGFIVKQEANKYIVITNQHVLRAGEAPYKIEASDGKTYPAKIIADVEIEDLQYDLAILEFEADTIYSTATLGNSLDLEVGEPVFAAGFPYGELETSQATPALFEKSKNGSLELALKQGRVVIILDRALEEGYQIGYTNDVRKGMSGGPLLNSRGEVVGVNGKHAYPLWESPEFYQDGQEPCPALQDLITRSSLAIPIEKSLESPQLKSLKLSDSKLTRQSNLSAEDSQLISQMQLEAQRTIQSCQNIKQ